MTHSDRELLDKIAAEAEHAESTRDAELPYRRRTTGRTVCTGCGYRPSGSSNYATSPRLAASSPACWCANG